MSLYYVTVIFPVFLCANKKIVAWKQTRKKTQSFSGILSVIHCNAAMLHRVFCLECNWYSTKHSAELQRWQRGRCRPQQPNQLLWTAVLGPGKGLTPDTGSSSTFNLKYCCFVAASLSVPAFCKIHISFLMWKLLSSAVTRGYNPPNKPKGFTAKRFILFSKKGSYNSHYCHLELNIENAQERNFRA